MLTEPDLMIGRDADRTRLDDWSRHIILKRFCNVPLSYMSLRLGLYSTIMKKISFFSLDIIKQALLPGTRQRLAKETRTGSRDAFRNQVRGGGMANMGLEVGERIQWKIAKRLIISPTHG